LSPAVLLRLVFPTGQQLAARLASFSLHKRTTVRQHGKGRPGAKWRNTRCAPCNKPDARLGSDSWCAAREPAQLPVVLLVRPADDALHRPRDHGGQHLHRGPHDQVGMRAWVAAPCGTGQYMVDSVHESSGSPA